MNPVVTYSAHIGITTANGGYAVQSCVWDKETEESHYELNVFTDIEVMLAFVRRVTISMEGAGIGPKLGPLKVPE